MLIHLILSAASVFCVPQDNAGLHTSKAELFVDIPDVASFVGAWRETAIAKIAMDKELAGLLEIAGFSSPEQALEQLQAPELKQALALLGNVKGVSFSASLDEGAFDALVDEFRTFVTSSQQADLEFLCDRIEGDYLSTGALPRDLDALGLGEYLLLDSYGRRFDYKPGHDGTFTLQALGEDGVLGGVGGDQDLGAYDELVPLAISRVASLVGLELVVEWHHPEHVAPLLGMLYAQAQANLPFLQMTILKPMEGAVPPPFPPTSFRVAPEDLGGPGGAPPIEFSLQMVENRTFATFGMIQGRELTDPIQKTLAGEVAPTSLAATESYQKAMTHTSGGQGVVAWRGFVNTAMSASKSEAEPTASQAILDFMGVSGSKGGWVTRISNGLYQSDSCTSASPSQINTVASLANVAEWIPNDAVFVQTGAMNPRGMWELFLSLVGEDSDVTQLARGLGVDLTRDLVDNLGNEFAFWASPVSGISIPELFAIVPVTNEGDLMKALDALCDKLVELESDFSVSRRPYKGTSYTSLNVGIPVGLTPTFAVLDGKLWITNSSILIKREIRRRAKGEDYERGSHPLFTRILGEEGEVPENLRSAGYLDLGNILSSYYKGGLALSGMLSAGIDLPQEIFGALPSASIFSRHIAPSFSETTLQDGVLRTHKESAFGPEPIMLALGGGVAALYFATGNSWQEIFAPEPWTVVEERDAVEFEIAINMPLAEFDTRVAFPVIEVGLLLYSLEMGSNPSSLEFLLKPSKAYPNGYIGESKVPVDGWGNALHYALLSTGDYALYSFGPDGLDGGGAGDDILP